MDKVKLSDVAEQAGVSLTAVSFVLNGKPGVSDDTRKTVLRVLDEMGYTGSVKEKNQKKRRSAGKAILLLNCSRTAITSDIFPQTPYFSELLYAFEEKLSASGYQFWIRSLHIGESFEQDIKALLKASSVNGVLLVATDMLEEDVEIVRRVEPNIVVLDSCFDRCEANCVVMDNYLGGVLAARHIMGCGHKNIGYVQSNIRIYNFEMRKKGFFDELARSGVSVDPLNILEVEPSIDSSFAALERILTTRPKLPDCFFTENDYMAIGMLRALQKRGFAVPEQVSLVGFDNIDMAGVVTPGLTTVNVPKSKLAEFCVSQMIHILKSGPSLGIKHFIAVNLVERQTTKSF